MNQNNIIMCIDLKSFFASVECIDHGYNPFNTPLVVAEPNKQGAITLAVTPYLKKLGVPSRGRIFEIPKNIKYITAKPRMSLYIEKSKEVIDIYLEYVSKEDLHIYSIDECFLDFTNYMKLYKKEPHELAKDILNRIKEKTGLCATVGIGPNLLLAKVSMDIEAKHNNDFIAYWSNDDIKQKLWNITPLSNMWGIGKNLEKRLNSINIYSIKDLANYDKLKFKQKFGIIGLELWEHANGIDNSKIRDFNRESKEKSISNSQILYKDYYNDTIKIIIKEMCEILTSRLRKEKYQTKRISLYIGYSKDINKSINNSYTLDNAIDDNNEIYKYLNNLFDNYYEVNTPIRKVGISFSKLVENNSIQLNLFTRLEDKIIADKLNYTIDEIKTKYGKNSILKGSNLLKDSTMIERNNKIGGHNAR